MPNQPEHDAAPYRLNFAYKRSPQPNYSYNYVFEKVMELQAVT